MDQPFGNEWSRRCAPRNPTDSIASASTWRWESRDAVCCVTWCGAPQGSPWQVESRRSAEKGPAPNDASSHLALPGGVGCWGGAEALENFALVTINAAAAVAGLCRWTQRSLAAINPDYSRNLTARFVCSCRPFCFPQSRHGGLQLRGAGRHGDLQLRGRGSGKAGPVGP
jgi:hypothetical protein